MSKILQRCCELMVGALDFGSRSPGWLTWQYSWPKYCDRTFFYFEYLWPVFMFWMFKFFLENLFKDMFLTYYEPLLVGVFNSIFYSLMTGNTWLENTSCCVAYWHCHPQLCHYNSGGINTSVHDSDSALCQVWPDFSHQHCCINFLYPHNMCSFVVYYGSGEIPSLPHNFS